jgi:Tfp pilus assembly protein PilO
MLATRTRRWWAAGLGLSLALVAVSWFLLIQPRRGGAAERDAQVATLNAQAETLQLKTAQLKAQFAHLSTKQAQLKAIKAQLPATADLTTVVNTLETYAGRTGVSLDSITPGTPAVVSGSGTGTAQQPVLVSIPLTLQVTGDYFESSLFVKSVQASMTRSVLVTRLQLSQGGTAADAGAAKATSTVTANVFVLLDGSSTLKDVKKAAHSLH